MLIESELKEIDKINLPKIKQMNFLWFDSELNLTCDYPVALYLITEI